MGEWVANGLQPREMRGDQNHKEAETHYFRQKTTQYKTHAKYLTLVNLYGVCVCGGGGG